MKYLHHTYRTLLAVVCMLFITHGSTLTAKNITTRVGNWQVVYSTTSHSFGFSHQGKQVITASCPEATYSNKGVTYATSARDYADAKVHKEGGSRHFVLSDKEQEVSMILELTPCDDDILVRLVLSAENEITSNYLAPINITTPQLFEGSECRMLQVPYDNDGFVRYRYNKLDTGMLSYEVSSIFSGESRKGFVIGSIDHDHWKSGIMVQASAGNSIDSLRVYSGVSTHETHDILPHGSLVGKRIESARFLLSDATDWRNGMERFAQVCASNTAPRHQQSQFFNGESLIGWQSWGVMAEHNNFSVDMNVADYYAQRLRSSGFASEGGMQLISIDSWDNLNNEQRLQLTAHCEAQQQIMGIYRTPFSLWWGSEGDLKNPLYHGCEYPASECVLKANGKPIKYDGAFSLDPTHPAVKEMMRRNMDEARRQGFRYVKVDFVSNGMIQADSYYNPLVHTAVEAYNEGMAYFASQCYDRDNQPMFITLSIAPTFPYQYANARRIACDTWGKISHSEYAMNAIAGGWWTNGFYERNDPDHIVLVGNDKIKETEGENRARLTTGVVNGMVLLADNYDITDTVSHRGNPQLSRERAEKVLKNRDVNQLMRKVKTSFRPVYGYRPFDGKPESADNIVMHQIDGITYVAVINYDETPLTGSILLTDLGLNGNSYQANELWTSTEYAIKTTLNYQVPAKDARIYQIK